MHHFSNDLPHVQYLSDDTYIIITKAPLTFNLACEKQMRRKIDINVPNGFIRVRKVRRRLTELLLTEFMNTGPRIKFIIMHLVFYKRTTS